MGLSFDSAQYKCGGLCKEKSLISSTAIYNVFQRPSRHYNLRSRDGPYRAIKFLSPNIVHVEKLGERKRNVANISKLKPFFQEMNGDGEEQDPIDVEEETAEKASR